MTPFLMFIAGICTCIGLFQINGFLGFGSLLYGIAVGIDIADKGWK